MNHYTSIQEDQVKKFKEEHKKCKWKKNRNPCQYTYLETPTGIGDIDEIRCNFCGEVEDFTDVSVW